VTFWLLTKYFFDTVSLIEASTYSSARPAEVGGTEIHVEGGQVLVHISPECPFICATRLRHSNKPYLANVWAVGENAVNHASTAEKFIAQKRPKVVMLSRREEMSTSMSQSSSSDRNPNPSRQSGVGEYAMLSPCQASRRFGGIPRFIDGGSPYTFSQSPRLYDVRTEICVFDLATKLGMPRPTGLCRIRCLRHT
jgi:hypothetical protein